MLSLRAVQVVEWGRALDSHVSGPRFESQPEADFFFCVSLGLPRPIGYLFTGGGKTRLLSDVLTTHLPQYAF